MFFDDSGGVSICVLFTSFLISTRLAVPFCLEGVFLVWFNKLLCFVNDEKSADGVGSAVDIFTGSEAAV